MVSDKGCFVPEKDDNNGIGVNLINLYNEDGKIIQNPSFPIRDDSFAIKKEIYKHQEECIDSLKKIELNVIAGDYKNIHEFVSDIESAVDSYIEFCNETRLKEQKKLVNGYMDEVSGLQDRFINEDDGIADELELLEKRYNVSGEGYKFELPKSLKFSEKVNDLFAYANEIGTDRTALVYLERIGTLADKLIKNQD